MKSFFILVLSALLISVVGCSDQSPQSPQNTGVPSSNEIGGSGKHYVVYDFGASWCGPCRAFAPTFEEWKAKYTRDNVTFKQVNVEEDREATSKFGIEGLPTLIVTADGKEVGRFVGAPRAQQVAKFEEQVVKLLK